VLSWSLLASNDGGRPNGFVDVRIVLDSAFGLTDGSELRVAGVRAGVVERLEVSWQDSRAVAFLSVDPAIARLRVDATCQSRPQSLIGEYFVDCNPGRSERPLPFGSTLPVSRTSSVIAPDLVADAMRLPQRERLGLILRELGAGLAARGGDLRATLRRAVPALRASDALLAELAAEERTLGRLADDGEQVLAALDRDPGAIRRFVVGSAAASTVAGARPGAVSAGLRSLPGMLQELTPTSRRLAEAADGASATVTTLARDTAGLRGLLRSVSQASDAAGPALTRLGRTGRTAAPSLRAVTPALQTTSRSLEDAPELMRNLRIVGEDLDSRDRTVERDPRSPGGAGYTGLEAPLQFLFDQSQSSNVYDQTTYYLKAALLGDTECSAFFDPAKVRRQPQAAKRCAAGVGPEQPGRDAPATARAQAPVAPSAAAPAARESASVTPAPAPPPLPPPGRPPPHPAPVPRCERRTRGPVRRPLDFLLGS
jgi:ABC-type transporter Mla subunit MlaD